MLSENYYISDSVWNPEYSKWHDDTILYTLFKAKTVYINPDSWYAVYVEAFADDVVWDERVDAMINTKLIDQDTYTRMNHMSLVSHSTLFEEKVREVLSSSEEGLYLFIAEESVYSSNNIVLFHDDAGNIYLKGVDYEE